MSYRRTPPPTPRPQAKPVPPQERETGRWTFSLATRRFHREDGQFTAHDEVLVDTLDPLELHHTRGESPCGKVAGAATSQWIESMAEAGGTMFPCRACGRQVGLHELEMTTEHSRDWTKEA